MPQQIQENGWRWFDQHLIHLCIAVALFTISGLGFVMYKQYNDRKTGKSSLPPPPR